MHPHTKLLYDGCNLLIVKRVIIAYSNQHLPHDIEQGVAHGQRNIHHVKADIKPSPFKEPVSGKDKANIAEDCQIKKVPLYKHLPDKMVTISATLEQEEEQELLQFCCKNKDMFDWSASDLRDGRQQIHYRAQARYRSFYQARETKASQNVR